MNQYFITGTSKGLGKAIAEELLEKEENFVTGISRESSIEHKNYKHLYLDLSDPGFIDSFEFPDKNAEKIVLINNAGTLGEVGKIGEIENTNILNSYNVNILAPALLMNRFIAAFKKSKAEKIILNISSGAGKKPVDGWGPYCSTKSALDMLSLVTSEEQKIVSYTPFLVFSLAPGIVDTDMQTEIRSSRSDSFSRVEEFKDFKKNNHLISPKVVAKKIICILANAKHNKQVVFSVKDLD